MIVCDLCKSFLLFSRCYDTSELLSRTIGLHVISKRRLTLQTVCRGRPEPCFEIPGRCPRCSKHCSKRTSAGPWHTVYRVRRRLEIRSPPTEEIIVMPEVFLQEVMSCLSFCPGGMSRLSFSRGGMSRPRLCPGGMSCLRFCPGGMSRLSFCPRGYVMPEVFSRGYVMPEVGLAQGTCRIHPCWPHLWRK